MNVQSATSPQRHTLYDHVLPQTPKTPNLNNNRNEVATPKIQTTHRRTYHSIAVAFDFVCSQMFAGDNLFWSRQFGFRLSLWCSCRNNYYFNNNNNNIKYDYNGCVVYGAWKHTIEWMETTTTSSPSRALSTISLWCVLPRIVASFSCSSFILFSTLSLTHSLIHSRY